MAYGMPVSQAFCDSIPLQSTPRGVFSGALTGSEAPFCGLTKSGFDFAVRYSVDDTKEYDR